MHAMMKVAVVAHAGKTLGGGLPELRRRLYDEGVAEPLWREVRTSRNASREVASVLAQGAELVIVWGGDGMVQRSVDALAGTGASLAVVPAGTSNLFATNLGIEHDIGAAVRVALQGRRRRLDAGCLNGERFAVMAGVGFDATLIKGADARLKGHLGRAAYVLSAAANINVEPFQARIKVDGERWYRGPASCILFGNMGRLFGGVEVFPDAQPDDGWLDVGVVTAGGAAQMARTIARTAIGSASNSPFVRVTRARRVRVKLDRKVRYELDGGDRRKVRSIKVDTDAGAVTVCVPPSAEDLGEVAVHGDREPRP